MFNVLMTFFPQREGAADADSNNLELSQLTQLSWLRLLEPIVLLRVSFRATAVFLLVVLAVVHPMLRGLRGAAAAAAVGRWTRRILGVAGVTLDVQGAKPPHSALIVSNHRSYIDILAILSVMPASFLCKKEVQRWPLVGNAAARMGVIFVDRSSRESRAATLEEVALHVRGQADLVAFPEGTTSKGPGMQRTFPGLFRAAEEHGFPIVPMVIEYADPNDAWIDEDTLLRHVLFWLAKPNSAVTLRIGPELRVHPRGACEPFVADAQQCAIQSTAEAWMRHALQELNQGTTG